MPLFSVGYTNDVTLKLDISKGTSLMSLVLLAIRSPKQTPSITEGMDSE